MYTLVYIDLNKVKVTIGSTKIGQINMTKGQSRPNIPETFEKLDDDFSPLVKMIVFTKR
ncbi:Uncharacterised protein [Serratia marcescens]|nr:Uncharacterised protein [Serratia marcescens]CUZ35723.1 Uncharacterised protein [Serratia marcescens]CVG33633.1 Uncharacterised protein [Serratia marcescens]